MELVIIMDQWEFCLWIVVVRWMCRSESTSNVCWRVTTLVCLNTTKQIKTYTPSGSTLVNNHNYLSSNILKDSSSSNNFILYHQNIRGISSKIDECMISLYHNIPQIICLTEHHLKTEEIKNINLDRYILGAFFCRNKYKCGGVYIYI